MLCLEAGLDVLLEKPMVVTAGEARKLIETQRRTNGVLVVAFNGSLSQEVREAARLLRSGELGRILSVSATVWEGWSSRYDGHWKQNPVLSGGGFMLDTGAHMLNTVTDLVGEEFVEIAALLDNADGPVDVVGVVIGRLASGALVTMNACGAAIPSIGSNVDVYCTKGTVRTGVWGERLEVQRAGENRFAAIELHEPARVWDQFVAVHRGELPNPSPVDVGLRMAKLWDAIRLSAEQNGVPVRLSP
jgi:predicted dehydrogenase